MMLPSILRFLYVPLHIRLTLFYALILGLALYFFGSSVYSQAEQRAYHDLDTTLSSRAASVRLGKGIPDANDPNFVPKVLQSVDAVGTGGVAIEVIDVENGHPSLIATTENKGPAWEMMVDDLGKSPFPWDMQALHQAIQHPNDKDIYSTITFNNQHIRVYTLLNTDLGFTHVIQTARTLTDIEQSLNDLRHLFLYGGTLILLLALTGGWFMTWSVLAAVRRVTTTAHTISNSRDFSKRVPLKVSGRHDELSVLANTFNQMLTSLELAYQQQQRFVADASHELRAPITSIRCNLDLLAKAPDLPDEEIQAALSDTRAEAERMGRLVSDLLLLAHADELQQTHSSSHNGYKQVLGPKKAVDLDSLLLDVFRQYRPAEDEEQFGPRLLLQHIVPAQVYGDADQLKQVLVALVDNALKYTPSDGQVSLSLDIEEKRAIVKVSDSGIGVLSEDLPHIFERFYRADRARTRNRGGSGLGLSIARSIITEHRGTITVDSTPGKGSIFSLNLPVL